MIDSVVLADKKGKIYFGSDIENISGTSVLPAFNRPDEFIKTTQVPAEESKPEGFANLGKLEIPSLKEAKKTNNTKYLGIYIASASALVGGLILLIGKGPRGIAKYLNRLNTKMKAKIVSGKLRHEGVSKAYLFSQNAVDWMSKKFEIINNATSAKDWAFRDLMHNGLTGKITGKIHSKTTGVFEKICRGTVKKTYSRVSTNLSNVKAQTKISVSKLPSDYLAQKVVINGVERTRSEWLELASAMHGDVAKIYETNFGEKALLNRLFSMKKMTEALEQRVIKGGGIKNYISTDSFNTFIADALISSERTSLRNKVGASRKLITNTTRDLVEDANSRIVQIVQQLGYDNTSEISIIRKLQQQINSYVRLERKKGITSEDLQKARYSIENQIEQIISSLEKNDSALKSPEKNIEYKKLISDLIDLKTLFGTHSKGRVEEILDIYKQILPKKEYSQIESSYRTYTKSLDEAIKTEIEDFVNKERDLTLGSAPTDILSILGTFVTLGYFLGRSKDKQQRTTMALKYGIPAVVGVGTSLYFNAKLFAGAKGFLLGIISTFLTGALGDYSDNTLQKYYKKKNEASLLKAES